MTGFRASFSMAPVLRLARIWMLWLAAILLLHTLTPAQSQTPIIDRGRGKEMLRNIKQALKELWRRAAIACFA